jgi:transcriptional regulator with GAF, ATPase, and Fis domain
MNTKSYLTPTRKYNTLISCIHSIYRLVNSTYELKDLINRLARLIAQIFNARECCILLLDASKKYSIFRCQISDKKKRVTDAKVRVSNREEKKILKNLSSIRKGTFLGVPLISDDIIGMIIIKRAAADIPFDYSRTGDHRYKELTALRGAAEDRLRQYQVHGHYAGYARSPGIYPFALF